MFRKIRQIAFSVTIAFIAVFTMLEFFATAVPVAARGQERITARAEELALQDQPPPPPPFDIIIVSTDTNAYYGNSGYLLGIGTYAGSVKCNANNCSQKMSFELSGTGQSTLYEYKFSTRLGVGADPKRAVVGGTGTLTTGQQKERFSFTAVFEVNQDGTVKSTFIASNPDASIDIPRADGIFEIGKKNK